MICIDTYLEGLIKNLVRQEIEKIDKKNLKHISGKVLSLKDNGNIEISLYDGLNTTVILPNYTNQTLEVDNTVQIHYWGNISDGYIAYKNGMYL